jgi:hypothetical protein
MMRSPEFHRLADELAALLFEEQDSTVVEAAGTGPAAERSG